jgi:hypothetical protein
MDIYLFTGNQTKLHKFTKARLRFWKSESSNLNVTIDIGLTRVIFLDVTLDLAKDIYKPLKKPGDTSLNVSAWSNHPPEVIDNIPLGINRRLCNIIKQRCFPGGSHTPSGSF